LSLLTPQENSRLNPQEPSRLRNGRFAKGFSGNPRGPKAYLLKQAAIQKRAAGLLKALVTELGGRLSPVDLAFAESACAMLAKSAFIDKPERRVWLTNHALKIIDRLRGARPKRAPSLEEFGL
jgi:hypothetical protein